MLEKHRTGFLTTNYLKLILLLQFGMFYSVAIAQWTNVGISGALGIYLGVVNSDTLFYTTEDTGIIYRSFDGGESWTEFQTSAENVRIEDFSFPSHEIGYACGSTPFENNTGVVFKTENSGLTWDTLFTSLDFSGSTNIEFLNKDTGFVATGSEVIKTENGGMTFTTLEILPFGSHSIHKLTSNSSGVIFVSTTQYQGSDDNHRFSIYRSADLGLTWEEVYLNIVENPFDLNAYNIRDMHFPGSEVGYAVGGSGRVLKSIDAGLTWAESFISPFFNMKAVFFSSENVGYINNEFKIHKSIDGGETWTDQNILFSEVQDIQFATDDVGYAINIFNIFKTINGGEVVIGISGPEIADKLTVYPNPTRKDVTVEFSDGFIQTVEILDLNGKSILSVNEDYRSIDISRLEAGFYFLNVKTDKGIGIAKLVVE